MPTKRHDKEVYPPSDRPGILRELWQGRADFRLPGDKLNFHSYDYQMRSGFVARVGVGGGKFWLFVITKTRPSAASRVLSGYVRICDEYRSLGKYLGHTTIVEITPDNLPSESEFVMVRHTEPLPAGARPERVPERTIPIEGTRGRIDILLNPKFARLKAA
jgi:hypothetical protein